MAHRISANGKYRSASRSNLVRSRRGSGLRSRSLPPHLLPGVTCRRASAGRIIGILVGLTLTAFFFFAITIVAGALSTAAAVGATMRQYEEVNSSLPNAADVSAGLFQTTRILDRNGVLLQDCLLYTSDAADEL